MRRLKIVGDAEIEAERYLALAPERARGMATLKPGRDDLLGLFSLELTYPIFEPYEIMIHSRMKFRRLFFAHYSYGSRVSECIALARSEFLRLTGFAPMFVFAPGVPDDLFGSVREGCVLIQAEWMPARCVAVGGCDVG
jgi:hypothetical protein